MVQSGSSKAMLPTNLLTDCNELNIRFIVIVKTIPLLELPLDIARRRLRTSDWPYLGGAA